MLPNKAFFFFLKSSWCERHSTLVKAEGTQPGRGRAGAPLSSLGPLHPQHPAFSHCSSCPCTALGTWPGLRLPSQMCSYHRGVKWPEASRCQLVRADFYILNFQELYEPVGSLKMSPGGKYLCHRKLTNAMNVSPTPQGQLSNT